MLKPFIISISALLLSHAAYADTIKTEAGITTLVNKIMGDTAKGDITAAMLDLKPYTIIPESDFQSALEATKSQRDLYATRIGKDIGYECFKQQKLGESLIRQACIEKTEKGAIAWEFIFYKSPTGWNLNTYSWSPSAVQTLFLLDK
jgi:hypothetical protein